MTTTTQSVRFHRVLRAPPERVWRAFVDPRALVKWIPPHGFAGEIHVMDARVGGGYRMSFTNLATGQSHSFTVTFVEMVPNELIRHTDRFDEPGPPGEMQVTVRLRPVACGTDLSILQEGIPEAIPAELCHLGWQESLALLALLVEAEVPA
jgi:uncharacterized protein YndB with AHSA1/START domain